MEEKLREIFAGNLKKQLVLHHKKQTDLAKYMNVSTATVSEWCSGKKMPRTDKIRSICNWLFIEMDDLLSESGSGNTPNYYLNEETAKVAQELFENKDLRILFDAAKDARPEDLKMAADLLKRFKETNPDG